METGNPSNTNGIPSQGVETELNSQRIAKHSSCAKVPLQMPEKGIQAFKKGLTGNSEGTKKPLKDMMDLHCFFCCAGDEKQVRNCSCYECPLWRYRSSKCKTHRAMLGNLKKSETLSPYEQAEVENLQKTVVEAEQRVIALAEKGCKRKRGLFRKAYSGKSRASAIKAEELYLANYDVGQVVPFDEWLEEEIRLWEEQENGPPGGSTPGRGKTKAETAAWYLLASDKEEVEKFSKEYGVQINSPQFTHLDATKDAESKACELERNGGDAK